MPSCSGGVDTGFFGDGIFFSAGLPASRWQKLVQSKIDVCRWMTWNPHGIYTLLLKFLMYI